MPSASESVAAFNAAAARALAAAVCTPLAATTAIGDVDGAPSGAWGLIQSRARARFSRARQEDRVLADATPRRRRDSRTIPMTAARGVWEMGILETRRAARPSEAGTPSSRSRSRDDARRVVSARRRRVTAEAASKDRARHQRKGGTVAQEITPAPPTVRSQAHDVKRSRRQLYHVCLEVHAVQQSSFGASERREVNCARRGARRDFAAARSRRARSGPLARLAMKRRTRLLGLGRQALSEGAAL